MASDPEGSTMSAIKRAEELGQLQAENERLAEQARVAARQAIELDRENERLLRIIADLIEGETAAEGTPKWYALRNARGALGPDDG